MAREYWGAWVLPLGLSCPSSFAETPNHNGVSPVQSSLKRADSELHAASRESEKEPAPAPTLGLPVRRYATLRLAPAGDGGGAHWHVTITFTMHSSSLLPVLSASALVYLQCV